MLKGEKISARGTEFQTHVSQTHGKQGCSFGFPLGTAVQRYNGPDPTNPAHSLLPCSAHSARAMRWGRGHRYAFPVVYRTTLGCTAVHWYTGTLTHSTPTQRYTSTLAHQYTVHWSGPHALIHLAQMGVVQARRCRTRQRDPFFCRFCAFCDLLLRPCSCRSPSSLHS